MPLSLIGAGFGRTGTTSIKFAYEQLGLGRCYHMTEVFPDKAASKRWARAADGDADWEEMFKDYTATVDWPGCHFWRELVELYPDAKVLLSVRDSESWFASTQATIFSDLTSSRQETALAPGFMDMFEKVVAADFDCPLNDHDGCIRVYERHNAEVIRSIPREQLLVYDVKEGWEPLCRFLSVSVPTAPFPRVNTTDDFLNRPSSERATHLGDDR